MKAAAAAVVLVAFLVLGVRAYRAGLASGYVDPVGRIAAQDEALYAHSAIRMARQGGWLTPMFLGRYGLYKPPLLAWAGAASARLFGVSAFTLRLPVVLAMAFATALAFLWAAGLRGWQAGVIAVLLLLGNRMWQMLGGMFLTDGLLAAADTAALYCLYRDPRLERRGPFLGFALATTAAIMTKSIAGLLPPLAWLLYAAIVRSEDRPRIARVIRVGALTAALALPWFVYQGIAHSRWFWAEHVRMEILAYGAGEPPQTSQEDRFWFYTRRLGGLEPVLAVCCVLALPWFFAALRRRQPQVVLLACWLLVATAAALSWRYRNATYLLPAASGIAVLAASFGPLASRRRVAPFAAAALVLIFAFKAGRPDLPWSLNFAPEHANAAAALETYNAMARGRELILIDTDDEFYATVLPLRVRYCRVMPEPPRSPYLLDFRDMGVMVNAAEFAGLEKLAPRFRARLREWGADSEEPIATVVIASGERDLWTIIASRPEADFVAPSRYQPVLTATGRHVMPQSGGHVLGLAVGAEWSAFGITRVKAER